MSDTFDGMVIAPGSEHDGKMASSKATWMRLACAPPKIVPSTSKAKAAPVSLRSGWEGFVWLKVETPTRTHGFWVPDGRDFEYLMAALVVTYGRKK